VPTNLKKSKKITMPIRHYSSQINPSVIIKKKLNLNPVIAYDISDTNKNFIIKETKGKIGIYRFINKLSGKTYVGSSSNLGNRFTKYFNLNYISNHKNDLSISRALIKYGYSNFTV
jgi:hypothetical protein